MRKSRNQLAQPTGDGWERIAFNHVIELVEMAPERERWRWRKRHLKGRVQLLLRKPDGTLVQFKLQGGAWIRPLCE